VCISAFNLIFNVRPDCGVEGPVLPNGAVRKTLHYLSLLSRTSTVFHDSPHKSHFVKNLLFYLVNNLALCGITPPTISMDKHDQPFQLPHNEEMARRAS
jgi:hypothetical protein